MWEPAGDEITNLLHVRRSCLWHGTHASFWKLGITRFGPAWKTVDLEPHKRQRVETRKPRGDNFKCVQRVSSQTNPARGLLS